MEETLSHAILDSSSLLDSLPDAICRIDRGLRCLYANRPSQTHLGVARGTAIGSNRKIGTLPAQVGREWAVKCRSVLKSGRGASVQLKCRERTDSRCYSVRIVPEVNRRGEVRSVLCIATDVTEHTSGASGYAPHSCEAKADHGCSGDRIPHVNPYANEFMQEDFLARLSHELRTPLNAILGWTQTLQSSDAGQETLLRALRQIEQSALAQARLIDELLAYDAGQARGALLAVDSPSPPQDLLYPPHDNVHPHLRLARPRLGGLRRLAVDDDRNTRDMLHEALTRAGACVCSAASARDALDQLQRCRPDVLVSDIGMPDEDGCDLMRRVRALPAERGGAIPAVALTGYAREDDQTAARQAGYQAIAIKPVNLGELMATILAVAPRR